MRCTVSAIPILCGSILAGIILALASIKYGSPGEQYSKWKKSQEVPISLLYRDKLKKANLTQTQGKIPGLKLIPEVQYLQADVKLLCLVLMNGHGSGIHSGYIPVMTTSYKAIKETWGRHCSDVYFFGHNPKELDYVQIKARNIESWGAVQEIISYILSQGHLERYDWFTFVEEDTFLIVENLLYYLSVKNATDPIYLGHASANWGTSYNAGGAGYVLSKSAVRKLQSHLIKGHCRYKNDFGDRGIGRCLSEVGIQAEDTRDSFGRGHFLVTDPETLIVPNKLLLSDTLWSNSKYVSPEGPDCCSDYAVSFHSISPNMMYVMEYLVYHLKPYGISANLVAPRNASPSSSNV